MVSITAKFSSWQASILVLAILSRSPAITALDEVNPVSDLLSAQDVASDGVIRLTSESFSKYISGKQRNFALIVYLTASSLLDKPGLSLGPMRKEFGYVAKTLKDRLNKEEIGPVNLFFADADFKESQELFHRLGVTQLPYVFYLSPTTAADKERLKIKADDILKPASYDVFPWTSEEFSRFLKEKTGVDVGKVDKPSLLKSPLFPLLALALLTGIAVVGYNLYYADFMKNLLLWMAGSILVYWFSVSGGMHNIIRGIPLYILTHQGAQFFMPPGQGQMGAEGFMCGTGYLAVGLSVSAITYLTVLTPGWKPQHRRYLAFAIIAFAIWIFTWVVGVYRWKTGYRWRTYFLGWMG